MSAAGFEYTSDGDTAACKRQNSSEHIEIAATDFQSLTNILRETDLIQQVRKRSFSHWSQPLMPSSVQMIEAGFFYCNVRDRVICIYCNLICQQWTSQTDDPCEIHRTLSPNCPYVKGKLIRPSASSTVIVNETLASADPEPLQSNEIDSSAACHPAYMEIPKRHATWSHSDLLRSTNPTTNHRKLSIPDENALATLVAARLDLPISQRLLDQYFKLSIIKRCWEDQLRSKREDFVAEIDLYVACLILQKQIEHIDGKKENIVVPRLRMKYIREDRNRERYETNFTEEKTKTIEREKRLKNWPHTSPSRMDMLLAGWSLNTKKGRDFTECPYCGVECNHWEPNDNPFRIHSRRSPFCPYILSEHPIPFSSVPIKTLKELFTKEKIKSDVNQSTSSLITTSTSSYSLPPTRENTFNRFPGGRPSNIEELVKSGFYYTGDSTTVKCYHCERIASDLHQCSSNEIDNRHRTQFPYCHFAQLLPRQGERRPTNDADLCKWCLVNLKELISYPCMHLAVCGSCAQRVTSCVICGAKAEAFTKLYA